MIRTFTFSKTNITKEELKEEMAKVIENGKYFEINESGDEFIVIISYDDKEKAEELVKEIGKRVKIYENSLANTLYLSAFVLFISQFIF